MIQPAAMLYGIQKMFGDQARTRTKQAYGRLIDAHLLVAGVLGAGLLRINGVVTEITATSEPRNGLFAAFVIGLKACESAIEEVQHRVEEMLAKLPPEEAASFMFEQWWAVELPGRGYSPQDATGFDEAKWQSFEHALMNITTQIRFLPQHKPDLMGLPYESALSRALERRRVEEEERERAKAAKLEADKAARLNDLQNRAARQIGDEAESWLTTANEKTSGQSPLAAAASESGYHDAIRALADKVRENEKLQSARERKDKAVAELSAAAHSRYVDPVRADLWMRGKRHELGGKSPEEFVIDDITRQRCMELLPSKRSKY